MFQNLSERLSNVVKKLRGQGRLSEENIDATLREVRMALLEADVALPVVKTFTEQVRARALGQEVIGTLTPGQALIRVVRDELTAMMGEAGEGLDFAAEPPVVILLAGLQGSGKTTSAAKLARRLREQERKSVAMVSCDIYRPAAIEQLRVLAAEVGVDCYPSAPGASAITIAESALAQARRELKDVLIIDTAGRLAIDDAMMDEIRNLHAAIHPRETLFVIDSMMGQDAVRTAQAFNEALPLTGVILTKTDGDARGGAALSVRQFTGKPIKFMGVGEKTHALEPFHPDRIASRILGMGDVLSLIEEVEQKVDREQAAKVAAKISKGKGFDLQDFRAQLEQMRNMGGLTALMGKLPGTAELPEHIKSRVNDREMLRLAAIIDSMTPQERVFPAIIKASRKKRIADGSGTQVQEVNRLLKQFDQMQRVMKKVSKKGGLQAMMRGLKGRMPPGMPFQ
ncbi:MAG: signal recognition particle protein [Gammaproteobacteria bacterium]|nr:signal recognition particle protein [Gammaproteobacteria bacterium]